MPELKDRAKPAKKGYKKEFVLSKAEDRFLKQVGQRILEATSKQSQSLEGLAFRTGLSRASIYNIIGGHSNFKILTIITIANELKIDYHDLLP